MTLKIKIAKSHMLGRKKKMNWKILALLPALTLITALPAYSLTKNKTQSPAATTPVAESTQQGNMARKPNVMNKPKSAAKRSTSNVLTVGSTGQAVKTAQSSLKRQGFYKGSVNGVFDRKTRAAVIQFQKSKGLRADGIIGQRTLAALK
jgi:peptidoglycan hydrolase-like protein with peptidoglycan-binding domain